MSQNFDINPDITQARTMPSRFYTDEAVFQASKDTIFARAWQLVATENDLDKDVFPSLLLKDFLDEPIFISRSENNALYCLSNVCTHRGKILVEKKCDATLLRCRYHGRRFALGGKFLSMPEFEKAKDFPSPADDLPRIPLAHFGPLYFASLNPAAPFEEFVKDVSALVNQKQINGLYLAATKEYTVKAHWALYCENYLEGFHIPFVHHALNEELDYGSYETSLFRYGSLQTGYGKTGEVAAQYFFVFPNLMLNFYPWGLSVNFVRPVRRDLTIVEYLTFVSEETKVSQGAGGDLETVEFEDQSVVESVQKGVHSRLYDRGRYSPTREQGCHHFHRLLAEFIA
jgi:choline monooxygenase